MSATLVSEDIIDRARVSRRRRWRRRDRVSRMVKWYANANDGLPPRWKNCGMCGLAMGAGVAIKAAEGRCWPSGVITCANVWVCPVCSARIRTRRQIELQDACTRWVAEGGQLAMVTLTVRHFGYMPLREVLEGLLGSYRQMSRWKAFKAVRSQTAGIVRSLEVTHSIRGNGWHPHLHCLLFVNVGITSQQTQNLARGLDDSWRELVTGALGVSPSLQRGINCQWFGTDSVHAAEYVMKIAKEMTLADSKSDRDPFMFLDSDIPADVGHFYEYADTMRGRQSIAWSKGLRQRLRMGPSQTDEELALEDDEGQTVLFVPWADWNRIYRQGLAIDLVERCEREYWGCGYAPLLLAE